MLTISEYIFKNTLLSQMSKIFAWILFLSRFCLLLNILECLLGGTFALARKTLHLLVLHYSRALQSSLRLHWLHLRVCFVLFGCGFWFSCLLVRALAHVPPCVFVLVRACSCVRESGICLFSCMLCTIVERLRENPR